MHVNIGQEMDKKNNYLDEFLKKKNTITSRNSIHFLNRTTRIYGQTETNCSYTKKPLERS